MNDEARYDEHRRRLFRIYCNVCGKLAWKRAGMRFCSKACAAERQWDEQPKAAPSGAAHYAWKGAGAGYQAFHLRVLRARGSASQCEQREAAGCTSVKYEWSHIGGTDPGVPANYRALCKPCHQRYDKQTGADHANAKLTVEQVAAVRERYAAGGTSQVALAAEFGVSQGGISNIVRGKTYSKE